MRIIYFLLLCLFISPTFAQSDASCPAIVTQALKTVADKCTKLNLNEACYGNFMVSATTFSQEEVFVNVGEYASLTDIQSIQVSGMLDDNTWGIALLQIHRNFPMSCPVRL